jgi:uncharacterized protein YcgI (DUF1989 family)
VWPLWITGALLFGGAVATLAVPPALRRACLAVSGVGLVATVAVYTLLPSAPSAPRGLSVSIAAPAAGATVSSPVVVKVCGGSGSNIPGTGRLLSVSIDGRQVAEVNADTAAVTVAAGAHTLRVELVTSDHRAYAPPVSTDQEITVAGVGPPAEAPRCG